MLVSVGSATFTVLSIYAFAGPGGDQGRVAAQIVSGIGLGAGAILKYGVNVRGLDDRGQPLGGRRRRHGRGCRGMGVALGATVIVIVSLGPARFLERRMFGRSRSRLQVQVTAADLPAMGRLMDAIDEDGIISASREHAVRERAPPGRHRDPRQDRSGCGGLPGRARRARRRRRGGHGTQRGLTAAEPVRSPLRALLDMARSRRCPGSPSPLRGKSDRAPPRVARAARRRPARPALLPDARGRDRRVRRAGGDPHHAARSR